MKKWRNLIVKTLLLCFYYFNEINKNNLNYVAELLNLNNPNDVCSKLHFICQNKLKNYSKSNQNQD